MAEPLGESGSGTLSCLDFSFEQYRRLRINNCRSVRIACSGDIPTLFVFLEEVADADDGYRSL
jgi:hypothetical protein